MSTINDDGLTATSDNSGSVFSHSLQYAEMGYEVSPLVPGQKRPATKNGCNNATTDLESIERWGEEHPDANIGIKAGTDVLILDIDNKDGKSGTDDLERIRNRSGRLFFYIQRV